MKPYLLFSLLYSISCLASESSIASGVIKLSPESDLRLHLYEDDFRIDSRSGRKYVTGQTLFDAMLKALFDDPIRFSRYGGKRIIFVYAGKAVESNDVFSIDELKNVTDWGKIIVRSE